MKKLAQLIPLFVLTTLLTIPAFAETIKKSYTLDLTDPKKPVSLDVELRFGDITIIGYKGDKVEISATFSDLDESELKKQKPYRNTWLEKEKSKPRSSDGLKRITNSSIQLDIREDDNEVEITSEIQNRLITLEIRVPTRTDVEADIYAGGDVKVQNITGALELENHRGGITAPKQ